MPDKDVARLEEQISQIDGVDTTLSKTDVVDAQIPADVLPSSLTDAIYSDGSTMIIVTFKDAAARRFHDECDRGN